MATVVSPTEWHEGEVAMHHALRVPPFENPTSYGLPAPYAMRVMHSHLIALGTLDNLGRPWTTVWGGERGFARPVAEGFVGMQSAVDQQWDPVYGAFWAASKGEEDEARPGGDRGKMMSALAIDLETRDRVKLAGRMVVGVKVPDQESQVQLVMHVEESLGNCPKYINKKALVQRTPKPEFICDGRGPLPQEAVRLINRADMFFMSSTDGKTMDTNHRGGPRGFIRVIRNDKDGVAIVYPECESPSISDSGNRLYQSLGNIQVDPLVGIVIPDYETSDALYLTGSASVMLGEQASSVMAKSSLVVKISVSFARYVKNTLPFYGTPKEPSPYNPAVRYLVSERTPAAAPSSNGPDISANLVRRENITPTISVFTFKLESRDAIPKRLPGQHITLNFEPEVGSGYAHMRDDDPQSLNDDYVRTFTVSNPLGSGPEDEVQVTARLNGPVTHFLWRHNVRSPLDIPVLGFGGEESFGLPTSMDAEAKEPVFIAGGVGITPILAQAKAVLEGGVPLTLLWTMRSDDLPLASHVLEQIPELAAVTTLFVTGDTYRSDVSLQMEEISESGAMVVDRRIGILHLKVLKGQGKKFYLCTGPALLKSLQQWLEGEDLVWEDFGY